MGNGDESHEGFLADMQDIGEVPASRVHPTMCFPAVTDAIVQPASLIVSSSGENHNTC